MYKSILFLCFFILGNTGLYAQDKVLKKPCDLVKEKLIQDTVTSFNSQRIVQLKLLTDIKESKSCVEIRVYNYGSTNSNLSVTTIKNDGDLLYYKTDTYIFSKYRPNGDKKWKELNVQSGKSSFKAYTMSASKPVSNIFLDTIKDSGLFTISSWEKEKAKLMKAHQIDKDGSEGLDVSHAIVEIKLGNKYRNFLLGNTFNDGYKDDYSIQLKKILQLLKTLKNQQ